jgi:hypothetical protein
MGKTKPKIIGKTAIIYASKKNVKTVLGFNKNL